MFFFSAEKVQYTLRSLINVASQVNIALYNIPKIDKHSLLKKRSPPKICESYMVDIPSSLFVNEDIIFSHASHDSRLQFLYQSKYQNKFLFKVKKVLP